MLNNVMILCDSAQVYEGKLSILGGGWDRIVFGSPFAVAAIVEIPWDQTGQLLQSRLELVDADGHAVKPDGVNPFLIAGELNVERSDDATPGSVFGVPFAFNFGPVPIPAGRHTMRLTVDDHVVSRSFTMHE